MPNADAGADIVIQLGAPAETATLDGSASDDPDDFPNPTLTFQWTFVSTPPGSTLTNANITDANTATPSFTPDVAGFYTLELVVFDGEDQDTDQVMVKANAAPVAVDDSFTTDEDVPLNVPAPGVLSNDTDANSDPLTAVLVSGQPPNAQSFTFNPDGSFNYTPDADFNGTDSFTYNANDGSVDSNVATVTITVTPANDLPVAVDDAYSVNEGSPLTGTSVLGNDTDAENATLTAVLDTGPTNAQSFTLNPDSTFGYTPNADFFGTDTFTYHANDGTSDSNVATATITVNAVNDTPSFTAGPNQTVLEDTGAVTVAWATGISAGPANESGQTFTFLVSNNNALLFSAQPAVSSSGVLTFTPAPNANGSATVTVTLQYNGGTANGGVDTSGQQGFTITVMAVNDPPVVTPPAAYAAHAHIGISIPNGVTDLLDASIITDVDGAGALPFSITPGTVASTNAGSAIIAADGSFTYNPPVGFTGANDTFTYQICDSGVPGSACTNATATVTVSGPRVWFVTRCG
ncbi:MAG: Ig-like domain-containing protein [Gammaproteobacteria bacterium]